MSEKTDLEDLLVCYRNSPHPSFKVTNYFEIYADLFKHLRGSDCTFIEIGVLNGGSLFMWRDWLGKKARIIGIDLNPAAKKWESEGFEIFIGDQGDPKFWSDAFNQIGEFDALIDDGGHQSFQQIVTLIAALSAARRKCVIAVEDTCTSFFKEFSAHHQHSFTEYCKDATDMLLAKTSHFFENQFPKIINQGTVQNFSCVRSIEFFPGIIAFKVDPESMKVPKLCWNKKPAENALDFRYEGVESAEIVWPDLLTKKVITLRGGKE